MERKGATLTKQTLENIKNPIVVLSGKGGVGKSFVATTLATFFSHKNFKVGLLDIDIHGPSIPHLLGLKNERLTQVDNKIQPVDYNNLKVVSIGFMLNQEDEPVIWRGPLKTSLIRQFLFDVNWGTLDFLFIDSPPGTGDEPLSILQLIANIKGVIIVTTPQKVSIIDVKKAINFCKKMNINILGIIENMNKYVCPHCGKTSDLFPSTITELSKDTNIPIIASIPFYPQIAVYSDEGNLSLIKNTDIIKEFEKVFKTITEI